MNEDSVAETAACLEIPEDTVKTRLHRARRLLRDDLAQQLDIASTDAFAFAGARCNEGCGSRFGPHCNQAFDLHYN